MSIPLALVICLVSGRLLYGIVTNGYYDYWIYPKEKIFPPYIYPQLRYTIFELILLAWCLDGLIAAASAIRGALWSRKISAWTYRMALLYFILFAALILDGTIMLIFRSHGI
ncbi:MAG TPA: hypothetical protein VKS20_13270 [Candidatus Acidoferrales bacterium]|nr:hypothetical protein [Candidatus Acidoferrales bacterium]